MESRPVSGLPWVISATPSGHIEELPSGSYRVHVYVGVDPITRRKVYLRETAKDLVKAQIVLGKLLAQAQAGKEPESGATVGQLLDAYVTLGRPALRSALVTGVSHRDVRGRRPGQFHRVTCRQLTVVEQAIWTD